jgi:hypothetical protein
MKDIIRQEVIIGTSIAMSFFETVNNKTVPPLSMNVGHHTSVQRMRDKMRQYSSNRFHFLAANCTDHHFFAINVKFDIRNEAIFEEVTAYDSMRKTKHINTNVEKTSSAGQ